MTTTTMTLATETAMATMAGKIRADLERWNHSNVDGELAKTLARVADASGPIEVILRSWNTSEWTGKAQRPNGDATVAVRWVCSYRDEADYEVRLGGSCLGRIILDTESGRATKVGAGGWYSWDLGDMRLDDVVLELLRRLEWEPTWTVTES